MPEHSIYVNRGNDRSEDAPIPHQMTKLNCTLSPQTINHHQ